MFNPNFYIYFKFTKQKFICSKGYSYQKQQYEQAITKLLQERSLYEEVVYYKQHRRASNKRLWIR